MMKKRNSKGFAHLAVVMVVLVVGVVGAVGVYVYKKNDTKSVGSCSAGGCTSNPFNSTTIAEAAILDSYELKDVGLKINPGKLTGLTMYRTELRQVTSDLDASKSFKEMSITFSTKSIEAASGSSPDCAAPAGALGSIGLSTVDNGNKKVEGTDWHFVVYASFSNDACLKLQGVKAAVDEATATFLSSVTIEKL